MDLKAQSTHCYSKTPGSDVYKIFKVKKWLNMNSKPDNKCGNSDDIILLSEIITNSIYQVRSPIIEIPRQYPAQTPPHFKKYPAYLASTPPVLIKTIPRHSGHIFSA